MAAGYQDCPRDWSRASRANHNHFPCICHHRHGNSLADRASGRRERSHWLVLCLLKEKGLSVTERRTRSTRHLPQCFALYAGGVSADVKPWCCLQVWRGKSETCGRGGQFLLQTLCFACQEQLIFFPRVGFRSSRFSGVTMERNVTEKTWEASQTEVQRFVRQIFNYLDNLFIIWRHFFKEEKIAAS